MNKIYEFNEHDVCINGDIEVVIQHKKNLSDVGVQFEFACKDGRWFYGYRINQHDSYLGGPCFLGKDGGFDTKKEARLDALDWAYKCLDPDKSKKPDQCIKARKKITAARTPQLSLF